MSKFEIPKTNRGDALFQSAVFTTVGAGECYTVTDNLRDSEARNRVLDATLQAVTTVAAVAQVMPEEVDQPEPKWAEKVFDLIRAYGASEVLGAALAFKLGGQLD